MRTKTDMLAEVAKIEKQLASGKLKGKAKQKAVYRKNNLKYRAKKKDETKAKVRKARAKKVNPDQGFLPSFLSQLSTVRIEEMIADRAFKAIKPALEKQLGISLDSKSVKVG